MKLEEIKKLRQKAYEKLKQLDGGADYETMADCYEVAFDLVDDALERAILIIEKLT